jgi:hypothetical protein
LQFNGIEFFKMFYHFKTEKRKNLYLLFTLWISHILIPVIFGLYQLFSNFNHESVSISSLPLIIFQEFFSFSVVWSVPFLMWNISVHAFENLVNMKQILIKQIERNSGISK